MRRTVILPLSIALAALAGCRDNAGQPMPQPPQATAVPTIAPAALPAEVAAFVTRREQCDHFRGEDPYDKERGRFIAEQLAKSCVGIDTALGRLRRRYGANQQVVAALSNFENKIE